MADPDRHGELDDEDRFEDEGRRSIFSALWFRAILVVVVLGVVAAVAVPYLLEWANPQPPQPTTASKPSGMTPPSAAPPAPLSPPPAQSVTPTPPPVAEKPAEKPEAAPTPPAVAQADKPAAPATEKPAAPAATKKPEVNKNAAAKDASPSKEPSATPRAKASASGSYFVQVGAFKDPETAKRLAARMRELKYDVDESQLRGAPAPAAKASAPPPAAAPSTGSDKYDVYVSGGVPAEINAKLSAKGLAAEQSSAGLVVKPSLPLRDAVALSKDLAVDGLKVQVRRSASGPAPAPAAPSAAPSAASNTTSDGTLYRVRIGPFDDKTAATSTLRELEQKGYSPFIARGGQ
jgi:SPOR domain